MQHRLAFFPREEVSVFHSEKCKGLLIAENAV